MKVRKILVVLTLISAMVLTIGVACSPETENTPSRIGSEVNEMGHEGENRGEHEGLSKASEGDNEDDREIVSEANKRDDEHARSESDDGEIGEDDREDDRESGNEHDGSEREYGSDEAEGSGANALALADAFDQTKNGARLNLRYDTASQTFVGSVENTASTTLTRVRVEVHLSNGVELGPTTPVDLPPGATMPLAISAIGQSFVTWSPHAEVGAGESSHEEGSENGDPSSPILALSESWDGMVNGIRTSMAYSSAAGGTFAGIAENTTDQKICGVQIELNLKLGTTTVVELGPQPVGDLAPGQSANVQLLVIDEPEATGKMFNAWEIHPEVFVCAGSSTPGGADGDNEDDSEGVGEHTGSKSGDGEIGESFHDYDDDYYGDYDDDYEIGARALALADAFDQTKNGVRLNLRYDTASQTFVGSVENTASTTLTRVRVEVYLSNGRELRPTTPVDLAPGAKIPLAISAIGQSFVTWSPHAEIGAGESFHEYEDYDEYEIGAKALALADAFDQTKNGVRLNLRYDTASQTFVGSVENTAGTTLTRVRVEVYLSNGRELRPTTPVDLAPGAKIPLAISAIGQSFVTWSPHAEIGAGESFHDYDDDYDDEYEIGAKALALADAFDQTKNGVRLNLRYDTASQTFVGSVENTAGTTLTRVRVEVYLSNGRELRPTTPVDLAPGAKIPLAISAIGQSFVTWSPHAEIGAGESFHDYDDDYEIGARALALADAFDQTKNGVRLNLRYDTASQTFVGSVENTASTTLTRVRVEVHLSNGIELRPTTPVDLAPGAKIPLAISAIGQSFVTWSPHAEIGAGESFHDYYDDDYDDDDD